MSVLINGMKIPKSCLDCPLYDDEESFCKAQNEFLNMMISNRGRAISCPLVELPEHHGDLIDRNDLIKESLADGAYGYVDTKEIYDAPTIVKAE